MPITRRVGNTRSPDRTSRSARTRS
jgi:hypothetical protein